MKIQTKPLVLRGNKISCNPFYVLSYLIISNQIKSNQSNFISIEISNFVVSEDNLIYKQMHSAQFANELHISLSHFHYAFDVYCYLFPLSFSFLF